MPRIIGSSSRVVDVDGLTIDELAGNVATRSDRISIALVNVAAPTQEPWLTLDYDEWICVLKGRIVLQLPGGGELEVKAGETVLVERGERFRPTFPEGGTQYVPVCLPAFRPDRCVREEGPTPSDVANKLQALHTAAAAAPTPAAAAAAPPPPAEVLYHMCEKARWEAAKAAGGAYFPPTFETDGCLTHATAVPQRLVETANHFYQGSAGDWVCLCLSRAALRRCGVVVRDEAAAPVGGRAVGDGWGGWVCPHIIGGIPTHGGVVDAELPMSREGGRFTGIEGLAV